MVPLIELDLHDALKRVKIARYIKLGEKGSLAATCDLQDGERAGELYIGYFTDGPELFGRLNPCTDDDWNDIRLHVEKDPDYSAQGAATHAVNQVRTIFNDPGDVLWLTFHNRRMYWTFIDPSVLPRKWGERGGTSRRTVGWRSFDINGKALDIWAITTRITQVQSYQRTVRIDARRKRTTKPRFCAFQIDPPPGAIDVAGSTPSSGMPLINLRRA